MLYTVAIIMSLGLGVMLSAYQYPAKPALDVVQLLPAPKALPEFYLQNHLGEGIVATTLFRGQWSLVFFGFTSCPDYCPLELQKLGKLLNLIRSNNRLRVIFVSVDPERDEQEKLANYVNFFHPQIIGVRGQNSVVAGFAQFFGAAYDRSVIIEGKLFRVPAGINMPNNAGDQYQVNHSTRIFVVNPDGEFIGSFSPPYETEGIMSDMQKLME